MGSSCSSPATSGVDNNDEINFSPTILHPTIENFQLSSKAAMKGAKLISTLMDYNGKLIIDGWQLKEDRDVKGKSVFENTYTRERISWVPLQSASREQGKSLDIIAPASHFIWIDDTLKGLKLEVDDNGNVGVIDVFDDCPWGLDGRQVMYNFVCMVNGILVSKQENLQQFNMLLKNSFKTNSMLHVLFSVNAGLNFQNYIQLGGMTDCSGIDSYTSMSAMSAWS